MKHLHQKTVFLLFVVLALLTVGATTWIYRQQKKVLPPVNLPTATSYTKNNTTPVQKPSDKLPVATTRPVDTAITESNLPKETNLAIPFVSQAPKKNWDADHEEFCEEASVLMATHYINNQALGSIEDTEKELYAIKDFEVKTFGFFNDTNADETVRILKEHYQVSTVETLENPTIVAIKKALASGKAVLVPAAGRQLENPHFTGEGPLYHMIVLKGYTADGQFISNDPGTQFGENYLYPIDRIMSAMHDWNNGNVDQGKKVIIIVG